MPRVQTVKGWIEPGELGFTHTHEHLVCFPPSAQMNLDYDFELPSTEKAIEELGYLHAAGAKTLVEGSCIDYGRDVKAYREIANRVEMNIIFKTGFNKGSFYPAWVHKASIDELAELMIDEIRHGADGTDSKPGVAKCGSLYNMIHPEEEKVTRAVARAHVDTGIPVWVHTEAGTMGLEQLDILEDEGVDLNKVVIGHSDRNPDLWYHKKIAVRGAYVGYDGPSKVKYYPDSVRVDLIKGMIAAGYGNRLMVSNDMGRRSYLRAYGGGPGLDFILTKFIPRLREEGVRDGDIEQIWYKNPADWLSFDLR